MCMQADPAAAQLQQLQDLQAQLAQQGAALQQKQGDCQHLQRLLDEQTQVLTLFVGLSSTCCRANPGLAHDAACVPAIALRLTCLVGVCSAPDSGPHKIHPPTAACTARPLLRSFPARATCTGAPCSLLTCAAVRQQRRELQTQRDEQDAALTRTQQECERLQQLLDSQAQVQSPWPVLTAGRVVHPLAARCYAAHCDWLSQSSCLRLAVLSWQCLS